MFWLLNETNVLNIIYIFYRSEKKSKLTTLKSNYSYAQYLFKLLILGRTLSLDRIKFKSEHFFFLIMQCLQKTLTWGFFYSIRLTIDLHSKSLFVEILHPMLYPLIFNLENLLSFWKRTSDLKTVELIVFIWVGSGILRTPHGSSTREKQTIANAPAYLVFYS